MATNSSARISSWVPAGLGILIAGALLLAYPLTGFDVAIGPDGPVYLWWTRLAAAEGLAAVGRPGVPAVALSLMDVLRLPPMVILGGIAGAFAAAVGLAGGVLAWQGGPRARGAVRFVAGTVLCGAFAVHLAAAYFANLAFAAMFLAACVALGRRGWGATVAAVVLFAAAGIAHPLFTLIGAAILLLAAALGWRSRDAGPFLASDPGRLIATAGGGAAVFAGALVGLDLLHAGTPYRIPTSQDAYLRASGLHDVLGNLFVERFWRHLSRYTLFLTLPLAVWGLIVTRDRVGRLLRAWGAVVLVGVIVGLVTRRVPAERFLTFAFVLPIASAIVIARLLKDRRIAVRIAAVAAAIAIVFTNALTWSQQKAYFDDDLAAEATAAAQVAQELPGGPLVFASNAKGVGAGYAASHDGNVYRAAMPASRIRDVTMYIGSSTLIGDGEPTLQDPIHDAMAVPSFEAIRDGGPFWLLVPERAPVDASQPWIADGRATLAAFEPVAPSGDDPLAPHPSWLFVLAGLASLGVMWVCGFGWARALFVPWQAVALAPAIGCAVLVAGGLLVSLVGLPLGDGWAGWIPVVLGGGAGYLAAQRIPRPQAADDVDQDDHEDDAHEGTGDPGDAGEQPLVEQG